MHTHTCPCHGEKTHKRGCGCCSRPSSKNHRCIDCHRIVPADDDNMTARDLRWKAEGRPARCRACRWESDKRQEIERRNAAGLDVSGLEAALARGFMGRPSERVLRKSIEDMAAAINGGRA